MDKKRASLLFKEAAEMGLGYAQWQYGDGSFKEDDWQRYHWWGRAASQRENIAICSLADAAVKQLELCKEGQSGRICFEVGAVCKGNIDADRNLLFGRRFQRETVLVVEGVVALHKKWCILAKRAMEAREDPGKAVLVVEDDLIVKMLVRKWLFDAGHECEAVDSAEQGFTVLADKGHQIWLVVFDVRITGKYAGIDLLDRVVQMAHERKLQTIMMSSSGEVIALALNHGCDEFMRKPLIKDLFLKRVETLKSLATLREKEAAEPSDESVEQNELTLQKLLQLERAQDACFSRRVSGRQDGR